MKFDNLFELRRGGKARLRRLPSIMDCMSIECIFDWESGRAGRIASRAGRQVWVAVTLVVAFAFPCTAAGQRIIYESRQGVEVPRDFGCIHHVGLEVCWPCLNGNNLYFGPDPDFNARINAVRLYGMGGLEWGNSTETAPGDYNWSRWDSAFAKFRRIGVKSVIYTIYNPPPFYTRHPHDYGGWRGQLPNSQGALDRWLTAITARYPEIKIVEVANEVFGPSIGDAFWIGTEQELATLADWVLDWRRKTGWQGKIWSPSIPGVLGNVRPFLAWLAAYPRTSEFDAIPAHFYHLTAERLGEPSSAATGWTAFLELRDGLRAAGIDKPIVDGEKGFDPGPVDAATIFNYGVKAAVMGIQQVCYFHWGSYGNDETNLGQPFRNSDVKQAFEDLSALAGKRITRVTEPSPGGRWIVTVSDGTRAGSKSGDAGR